MTRPLSSDSPLQRYVTVERLAELEDLQRRAAILIRQLQSGGGGGPGPGGHQDQPVYEQPGTPTGAPPDWPDTPPVVGSIWIDTDEPDPVGGVGPVGPAGPAGAAAGAAFSYLRTASGTGVAGTHPSFTSRQMAAGTAPNGDDLVIALSNDGFLLLFASYETNNGPSSHVVSLGFDGTLVMEAGNNTSGFTGYGIDGFAAGAPVGMGSIGVAKFGAPVVVPVTSGTHHFSLGLAGTSPGSAGLRNVRLMALFFKFP